MKQKMQEKLVEQRNNFNLSKELLTNFKDRQAEMHAARKYQKQFALCSTEFKIIDWSNTDFFKSVSGGHVDWNPSRLPDVLSEE